MIRTRTLGCALSAFALGLSAAGLSTIAQPTIEEEMDMERAMAEWTAASTPGPHHEALADHIGTWDTTMKIWMAPDAPPAESTGVATVSWLIEGRWLQEEYEGTMMGQPYTGFGIHGYDNYRKQYVSSWVDNTSTAMTTMHGSLSRDKSTITMFGTMNEPMTGEKGKTVKYTHERIDEDHYVFRVQEVQYAEPFTVVEIDYRRRK